MLITKSPLSLGKPKRKAQEPDQEPAEAAVPQNPPPPSEDVATKKKEKKEKEDRWVKYQSLLQTFAATKVTEVPHKLEYIGDLCCIVCTLTPTGTGYAQLNLKNTNSDIREANNITNSYYLVHLLALRAANRPPPAEGMEASHLCHNKLCFNAEHLRWEDNKTNKARNYCPFKIDGQLRCDEIHPPPACLAMHPKAAAGRDATGRFPGYKR